MGTASTFTPVLQEYLFLPLRVERMTDGTSGAELKEVLTQ